MKFHPPTNFQSVTIEHRGLPTADAGRAIDLLQDRRSPLISAAGTGPIEVRKKFYV